MVHDALSLSRSLYPLTLLLAFSPVVATFLCLSLLPPSERLFASPCAARSIGTLLARLFFPVSALSSSPSLRIIFYSLLAHPLIFAVLLSTAFPFSLTGTPCTPFLSISLAIASGSSLNLTLSLIPILLALSFNASLSESTRAATCPTHGPVGRKAGEHA